jgi:N-acetyl-anhydromuramyl-L-alanine amidase AmpD
MSVLALLRHPPPPKAITILPPTDLSLSVIWRGACWFTRGRYRPVRVIVIHTVVGSMAGMASHFNNEFSPPEAQASAHYGVGLDGRLEQYVLESDTAWANGRVEAGNTWPFSPDPNAETISIETEDLGRPDTQPVTEAQMAATYALCRSIMSRHPIEAICGHYVISPRSRSCPAARWRSTGKLEALATALGLRWVR